MGKRHNLASTIKKRTVEPYNADNEPVIHRAKKRDAATVLADLHLGLHVNRGIRFQ